MSLSINQTGKSAPHIFGFTTAELSQHRRLWWVTCCLIALVPLVNTFYQAYNYRSQVSITPTSYVYAGVKRWVQPHDTASTVTTIVTVASYAVFLYTSFADFPTEVSSVLITAGHYGMHTPLIVSSYFTASAKVRASTPFAVYMDQQPPTTLNCSLVPALLPSDMVYTDEPSSLEARAWLSVGLVASVPLYFYLVHAFRGSFLERRVRYGRSLTTALLLSLLWEFGYTTFILAPAWDAPGSTFWATFAALLLKWTFVSHWMALLYQSAPTDTQDLSRDVLFSMEYVGAPASVLSSALPALTRKLIQKAVSEVTGQDVTIDEEKEEATPQSSKKSGTHSGSTVVQRKKTAPTAGSPLDDDVSR